MTLRFVRVSLASISLCALLLPASSRAANDPPFSSKSAISIPVTGTIFWDAAAENVDVTGMAAGKIQVGYKGGPLQIKAGVGVALTGIGQTTHNTYNMKGKGALKMSWPTTMTSIDWTVAAVDGEPIPGIDVKLGHNPGGGALVIHLDFNSAGGVTGSSATINTLPTPSSATVMSAVQITN